MRSQQPAPLRDLNEILAGGVLQLGSADETDPPARHRPPRGRLLWVAVALVVMTGASIALWFQFGPQLHAFSSIRLFLQIARGWFPQDPPS